jgi:hypothetical protein
MLSFNLLPGSSMTLKSSPCTGNVNTWLRVAVFSTACIGKLTKMRSAVPVTSTLSEPAIGRSRTGMMTSVLFAERELMPIFNSQCPAVALEREFEIALSRRASNSNSKGEVVSNSFGIKNKRHSAS